MDMKKYRNQDKNSESEYIEQQYRNGIDAQDEAIVTSPAPNTLTQMQIKKNAYVRIVEQPAAKALRFRYECEGRSAGSIPGASSTPEFKTFPTIQVVGYKGRALVVVSCVSKDKPYRPHPHNLVGKDWCTKGVCTAKIEEANDMTITFNNLGVQCVKKKDIKESLKLREDINVDPFRTGFSHASQPSSIDLNVVRLCFQVILEGETYGKFSVPLRPVVSDPIYDKKSTSELVICELSQCTASAAGGQKIILLCEKVNKDDISVRFFEEQDGVLCWEDFGFFKFSNVHKQTAISFRTPAYKHQDIDKPVKAFIQLRRPSDGAVSEPLAFQIAPTVTDSNQPVTKKARLASDGGHLLRQLQKQEEKHMPNEHTNENTKMMNIMPEVSHINYLQQPTNLERNEAPAPSSYYQEQRTLGPTSLYRYPTPYDITPYHRYHAPVAPCTQSIYRGSQYQWPRTMDHPGIPKDQQQTPKADKMAGLYPPLNNLPNQNTTQYHEKQQTVYYYHQHNDDYKYLANKYHYDKMTKQTNFGQSNKVQHKEGLPSVPFQVDNSKNDVVIENDLSKHVLNNVCYNEKDVPKIAKLLNDQCSTVPKSVSKKQHDLKTIPSNLFNGAQYGEGPSFNNLMNIDNQQLTQLNSTDLTGLSGLLEPYCVPNEKNSAEKVAADHENMTDSFSKMSTSDIEDLTVANINDFNNL